MREAHGEKGECQILRRFFLSFWIRLLSGIRLEMLIVELHIFYNLIIYESFWTFLRSVELGDYQLDYVYIREKCNATLYHLSS